MPVVTNNTNNSNAANSVSCALDADCPCVCVCVCVCVCLLAALFCCFKEIARNAAALKEVLSRAEELAQEDNKACNTHTHMPHRASHLLITSRKNVKHLL